VILLCILIASPSLQQVLLLATAAPLPDTGMRVTMAHSTALLVCLLLSGADAARIPDILSKALGWSPGSTPSPPNFPDSYEVGCNAVWCVTVMYCTSFWYDLVVLAVT
jgi:hypothetical protein